MGIRRNSVRSLARESFESRGRRCSFQADHHLHRSHVLLGRLNFTLPFVLLPSRLQGCPPPLIFELGRHLVFLIHHMHQLRNRCPTVGRLRHLPLIFIALQLVLVLILLEESNEMAPSGLSCFVLGLVLFHCSCHPTQRLQLHRRSGVTL